jgi:hypothetical protein
MVGLLLDIRLSAPECSGSPEVLKAIFSRSHRATAGSSCGEYRKKAFMTRARAKGGNRPKKRERGFKNFS